MPSLVRPWVGLLCGGQSQARVGECSPTAQVQLRLPRQITAQGAGASLLIWPAPPCVNCVLEAELLHAALN